MSCRCMGCNKEFDNYELAVMHQINDGCSLGKEIKVIKTIEVTYRDYLMTAARKHPDIYQRYAERSNPGEPENVWNPLSTRNKTHA